MSEPNPKSLILLEDPDPGLDAEGEGGGTPSPTAPSPTTPSPTVPDTSRGLSDLQAKYAALEERFNRTETELREADNRLATADRMLAEVYREKGPDAHQALLDQVKPPTPPTTDQVIQDPGVATKYAAEYGEYVHRRTLAELTPFLGAVSQVGPQVDTLINLSSVQAKKIARDNVPEAHREAFDRAMPQIERIISGTQNAAQLKLDPRAYLLSFASMGGSVAAPTTPSPSPRTAGVNARPDTGGPSSTPERIPGYFVKWCHQAGYTEDKQVREMWKRRNANRQGFGS